MRDIGKKNIVFTISFDNIKKKLMRFSVSGQNRFNQQQITS